MDPVTGKQNRMSLRVFPMSNAECRCLENIHEWLNAVTLADVAMHIQLHVVKYSYNADSVTSIMAGKKKH